MAIEGADMTLDCLHMLCPMPIVKLSKAIKEVAIGQTLLLLADDPGARLDVQTWARTLGQELVSTEQEGKVLRFLIRRTT
ncbi:MAG: sulfurtransferase TusA family protein [Candidatus Dormibacteria bacterium]|jgi:tRNA 2-thiouridine synthesizing protein A